MIDQQYGDYQFEVHVDGLEGRTLNYPVDFAALERVPELKPYCLQNYSSMTPHRRGSLSHRKTTRGRRP